jgi:hypothetical protein
MKLLITTIGIMLFGVMAGSWVVNQGTLYNANAQSALQPPLQDAQQPSNITAAISIIPTLVEAMKSKIQVNLNEAITDAMNSVGGNSTAVSASIQPERGYLIYRVIVLDNNNNVHMILVDPANGSIVSKQQLPTEIMGGLFGGIPVSGPQFGGVRSFAGR